MPSLYFQITQRSWIWNLLVSLGLRHGNLPGGMATAKYKPGWIRNIVFQVCFPSAKIYLFGTMKGRSTLIINTNTINTKAAYVNTAAAWWWMSCKWCQHLFLMMVCATQPLRSDERSDPLVHMSPIAMVYAEVLVTLSLSFSLSSDYFRICSLIHSFMDSFELCIFRCKWFMHVVML